MKHLTLEELEAGLEDIRLSPKAEGRLHHIVRRPAVDQREVLEEGELDTTVGLVGDNWQFKPSSRTKDGSPHPDMQLNLMNSRVIALVAQQQERWALAGDQLYVDLDLSAENLPPGTQLELGTALIQVTDQPHRGCKKFVDRFGPAALKFVNSEMGEELHLRGINAKVIRNGTIRVGDVVRKAGHQ